MLRDSHHGPGSSPSAAPVTNLRLITGPPIHHHHCFSLRSLIYSGSCNLLSREDSSLSPHRGKLFNGGHLGPQGIKTENLCCSWGGFSRLPLPNAEQHPCRRDSKGALYVHALFLSRFPRGPRSCGGTVSPGPTEPQQGHVPRACRVGITADPLPPAGSPHPSSTPRPTHTSCICPWDVTEGL